MSPNPNPDAAAVVRSIADEYVAEVTRRFPGVEESLGGTRSADRWSDNTLAGRRAWEARQDELLARLARVDEGALFGRPEWLVHGMLREELESSVAQRVCRTELWGGVDQIFGWHIGATDAAATQRVGTAEHQARALARFRALPRFVDAEIANLRAGLAAGYTAPRANVERVIEQVQGMLTDDVTASPFYSPAERDSTSPAFRARWAALLRSDVYPAMGRYLQFLRTEYLPRARTEPGLSAIPNGRECYRAVVRGQTSVDRTPEQMRDASRAARAALDAELAPLALKVTGAADLREARSRLKTDTKLAFASREARLAETRALVEALHAGLPKLFSRVPTTPIVVEPAPAYAERSRPPAWYDTAPLDGSRPATYYINLYNSEQTPRTDLGASASHEAWPGHHLQIAWVAEKEVPHPVMRLLSTSAFVEGWGMYAERLAYESGVIEDDLLRAGILAHLGDALLALELDPGIHAFGGTREAAVDSMMAISGRPRAQAESYADRHAATPGQLVTYMTGYLEIMRLRERAKRELGDAFTLPEFHDVVLDDGPVTLAMLERKVDRWIAAKKAGR